MVDCREVDVLVIGAGPTGLGAAKRLNQLVRALPSFFFETIVAVTLCAFAEFGLEGR